MFGSNKFFILLLFCSTVITLGLSFYAWRRHEKADALAFARDTVVECFDDAVIVLDRQLRIVDFNPAAGKLLSSSSKPVVGALVQEFLPVSYDFGQLLTDTENRQVELELSLSDDHEAIFDLRISRLRKPSGKWVGILIVAHDVSERVAMVDDREKMILELEAAKTELTRQANFDFLTEIYNRRYFIEVAGHEFVRSLRYRRSLSLVMMDIDHFKEVNDTFGHEVGDRVLFVIAQAIKKELRQADTMARFGGEEFVALLPESSREQARAVAEKIRSTIAKLKIADIDSEFRLTISLGVAEMEDTDSLNDLLKQADMALYTAKKAGRNCVRISSERHDEDFCQESNPKVNS